MVIQVEPHVPRREQISSLAGGDSQLARSLENLFIKVRNLVHQTYWTFLAVPVVVTEGAGFVPILTLVTDEIIGDFYRRRGLRIGADDDSLLSEHIKNGLQSFKGVRRARWYNSKLSCCSQIRAAENVPGNKNLLGLSVKRR